MEVRELVFHPLVRRPLQLQQPLLELLDAGVFEAFPRHEPAALEVFDFLGAFFLHFAEFVFKLELHFNMLVF